MSGPANDFFWKNNFIYTTWLKELRKGEKRGQEGRGSGVTEAWGSSPLGHTRQRRGGPGVGACPTRGRCCPLLWVSAGAASTGPLSCLLLQRAGMCPERAPAGCWGAQSGKAVLLLAGHLWFIVRDAKEYATQQQQPRGDAETEPGLYRQGSQERPGWGAAGPGSASGALSPGSQGVKRPPQSTAVPAPQPSSVRHQRHERVCLRYWEGVGSVGGGFPSNGETGRSPEPGAHPGSVPLLLESDKAPVTLRQTSWGGAERVSGPQHWGRMAGEGSSGTLVPRGVQRHTCPESLRNSFQGRGGAGAASTCQSTRPPPPRPCSPSPPPGPVLQGVWEGPSQ